jgi:phytoene/squalene synthetase
MQHKVLSNSWTKNRRAEDELDRKFKEITESYQNLIPHYATLIEAQKADVADGDFVTITDVGGYLTYRKINGVLVKGV